MPRKPKSKTHHPQRIEPTEIDIKRAWELLEPYYINNPDKLGDLTVKQKIDDVIERAKEGYSYCPKTFMGRIKGITKVRTKLLMSNKNDGSQFYNVREAQLQKTLEKKQAKFVSIFTPKDLRAMLSDDERKRWIEKEALYRQEFKFNNASDEPLLMQLLTEEIIQYRLIKQKLSGEIVNDKQLNESLNRLVIAQKNLGVTREQRRSVQDDSDGDVASLALKLEQKKAKLDAMREKDLQEERDLMEKRNSDELLNDIPEILRPVVKKAITSGDW